MADEQAIYVGNGKMFELQSGTGLRIEMDIAQLRDAIKHARAEKLTRTWTDRQGETHETVKLAALPLREVTEYRTHCVKLDTWKPDPSRRGGDRGSRQPEAAGVGERATDADDGGMEGCPF